jgi:hypothetical protein
MPFMSGTHRLRLIGWVVALATVAAVVGGCSSGTTMQNVWKDPAYTAGPMKKAIVFGIVQTSGARRTLEDSFVSSLAAQGVKATPSYELFPGDTVDKEAARAKIVAEGYDAIVVSKAIGKEQQTTYTGGTTYWGGYYGGMGAYGTGTTMTTEYVTFENSIWDPNGEGRLIWSGNTETLNPDSGPKFASSLIGKLMPEFAKAGLVPPMAQPK